MPREMAVFSQRGTAAGEWPPMRAAKGCIYGKPDHGSGASRKSDRYPNGRQTYGPGRPCRKATGTALQETGQGGLMQGEQGRGLPCAGRLPAKA